ncbi:MAG TPA: DMT family transporter [Geminicoccaceae bacterium]|nr:DMT family transporter [Geminicoccaceae bacterium]
MRLGPTSLPAWRRQWAGLPDNLRGASWVVLSAVLFTSMAAVVKSLGAQIDSFQLAFFRALFGLLLILPFALAAGLRTFRTRRLGMHMTRGIAGSIGMMCGFYALTHLTLADATAIGFTKPLFLIVLAALVLRETVRARRWSATALGFLGVLIMLRPGDGVLEPAALVALLGALAAATVSLLIKRLSASEPALTIMVYLGAVSVLTTALPAALVWQTPTWQELAWMLLAAALASAAQLCFIRGFRIGEASALAPLDYARLPCAALYGIALFAEVPDRYTLLGAALIVLSTLYIGRREAQLGQRPRANAEV